MSTNRKTISIFALLMSASMLFTGCGAHSSGSANYGTSSAYDDYAPQYSDGGADECNDATEYYYDQDYQEINNEEYRIINESGFKSVKAEPLSTFSIDVDTASYANVRRMIEDGYTLSQINPDAVRPEEFLNYFSYYSNKRGAIGLNGKLTALQITALAELIAAYLDDTELALLSASLVMLGDTLAAIAAHNDMNK